MTDLRKAAEMALEALKEIGDEWGFTSERTVPNRTKAIQALRQALADEAMAHVWEQKPVAWITRRTGDGGVYVDGYETCESTDYGAIPVYTAPSKREWVGLTDEDKNSFWRADQMTSEEWDELFAAVEAKLKEKNT